MADNDSRQYVIRVQGAMPGATPSVIGAVYLGGEQGEVRLLNQPAPFEISGSARIVSGMLQAANPSEAVVVEVFSAIATDEPQRVAMARGHTVLLGERLVGGTSRFIRTAP